MNWIASRIDGQAVFGLCALVMTNSGALPFTHHCERTA